MYSMAGSCGMIFVERVAPPVLPMEIIVSGGSLLSRDRKSYQTTLTVHIVNWSDSDSDKLHVTTRFLAPTRVLTNGSSMTRGSVMVPADDQETET